MRDSKYPWQSRDEELMALAGLLAGLTFFGPEDSFLELCAARIMALLELDLDVNVKFAAGRLILFYCEPRELRALGQRVHSLLSPSADRTDLAPHRLGHWFVYWSRCARYAKDPKQADAAEQRAREIAERHRLRDILGWLAFVDIERSLPERNVARAERALSVAEEMMDPVQLGAHPRLEYLRTKIALMKGQQDRAVFHASRATQFAIEIGLPPPLRAVFIVNEAQARMLSDDFTPALELLHQAVDLVPGHYAQEIRDMIALTTAYRAIGEGQEDGNKLLAAAWGSIRERQFYDTSRRVPRVRREALCARARARHRIRFRAHADRGAQYLAVAGQRAPSPWPWAIRACAPSAASRSNDTASR